jgi:hypothetical protein
MGYLMPPHMSSLDFLIALSPVLGATNACYGTLSWPSCPWGRGLGAKNVEFCCVKEH